MAYYTLLVSDVGTRVKRQFGDESAVQIVDADILRWCNDAQQAILDRNPSALQGTAQANTIANQATYTPTEILGAGLAGGFAQYRSVTYRRTSTEPYHRLQFLSNQQFDEVADWQKGPATGDPTCYTIIADVLNVYPAPDIAVTNGFQVWFNYRPATFTATSDAIALPPSLHQAVIYYVLRQAYMLDEDWNAAQLMDQMFERDLKQVRFTQEAGYKGEWDTYSSITTDIEDVW